nr:12-oxophytodienoate reductase [uncultured Duganella sp.]
MAPMTRTASPDGVPTEASAAYYQRRAAGQVGPILSEGTVIDRPASRNDPQIPFFHGEPALAGWKSVIDAVHGVGGRMGPQLWHTGATRSSEWEPEAPVESPSGLDAPGKPRGQAMSDGASQWKQQDLGVRLAETPAEMTDWLLPLVEAGVDVLHCSQRRFWEPEFPEIDGENGLSCAGWAKKLTGAVTIGLGSVGLDGDVLNAFAGKGSGVMSIDRLIERMERDEFDLIAVGRVLLTDPDWVAKIEAGKFDNLKGFDPASLAALV